MPLTASSTEYESPKTLATRRTAHLWLKSITWRLISTTTLFAIAWICTGSVESGGVVALIHMAITVVLYVPHELAWERLNCPTGTNRRCDSGPIVAPCARDH